MRLPPAVQVDVQSGTVRFFLPGLHKSEVKLQQVKGRGWSGEWWSAGDEAFRESTAEQRTRHSLSQMSSGSKAP